MREKTLLFLEKDSYLSNTLRGAGGARSVEDVDGVARGNGLEGKGDAAAAREDVGVVNDVVHSGKGRFLENEELSEPVLWKCKEGDEEEVQCVRPRKD